VCGDERRDLKDGADRELTITYPPVECTKQLYVGNGAYTYHWLGNTVSGVNPENELPPIFSKTPRRIPKAEGWAAALTEGRG